MIACYGKKIGRKSIVHLAEPGRTNTLCGIESGEILQHFPVWRYGLPIAEVWTPGDDEPESEFNRCTTCCNRGARRMLSPRAITERQREEERKVPNAELLAELQEAAA